MANDQSSPTLASGTIIVAGLAVAGSLFVAHDVPLQGSRPAMSESQFHQSATSQDIEARLWQDPFAAVAKVIETAEKAKPGKPANCSNDLAGATLSELPTHCKPPLAEKDPLALETTQVIGVTMPGAPYAEDGEVRRRTRYAVSSSLERAGFVPEDEHHLGYFRPQDQNPRLPEVVPYEWFTNSRADQQVTHHVLVLWLNEDALRDQPLHKLSSLITILRQEKDSPSQRDVPVRIVGPYSSDILLDMAREVETGEDGPCRLPEKPFGGGWRVGLEGVSFFTYAATVSDQELFKKVKHCGPPEDSVANGYFENRGINLYRTVATDEVLARGIVNELKRRNVEPGKVERANTKLAPEKRSQASEQHVALISEWDTFYGQTLPRTMERCFEDSHCSPDGATPSWVHKLTYLRGLDGQLPGTQGTDGQKSGKGSGEAGKQTTTLDYFKSEPDAKLADRPNGQGQQDYLRRLADHLQRIDAKLREDNQGRIRAIGILGSDVFDKLLLLRALRPKFPEALFFTTDLDATLTMGSELKFTRNLIVSSSFGPELRHEIQNEIPPFRGSYQAAAFLATALAVRAPDDGWEPYANRKQIAEWLSRSRIFEIGRTGDVIQYSTGGDIQGVADSSRITPRNRDKKTPAYVAQDASTEGRSAASPNRMQSVLPPFTGGLPENGCDRDLLPCDDIQLPVEDLYSKPQGLNSIAMTLAGSALLVLLTLCLPRVRKNAATEIALLGLALGAAAAACYSWTMFAGWLTENGDGEPLALLEGISVWPTVLLRTLSIVLCGYLLFRAWRKIDENLKETANKMCLKIEASKKPRSLLEKAKRIFSYRLLEGSETFDIAAAWNEYVYQNQFWPRFWRVSIYVLAMFLLMRFLIVPMFGQPIIPARGELARNLYLVTTYLDVILMWVLMFFVFDATLFCLFFVNELRHGSARWPDETRHIYEERLGLEHSLIGEWIYLAFVEKRTTCIGNLIYYPFWVIAVLILSRSTVFANYAPSLAIIISQAISLMVVFGCAFLLRQAAEMARETAKRKLTAGIVQAKGLEDGGRCAGQLETLLVRIEGLREGAFSPVSQQPLVRAMLLPLGSFGWTTLLENGMLPGL